ncbi:p10 [Sucra jujuba nucleopolyhedrovirus]|uniref:p10 n=1 Tax=Sucra jujuba nucleopolyhedrovirus TaxID=1563660 RepID=A0A097P8U7_9ABAC|nr:p10 [Sucra jujuba nucleopolyhedrovirus]AIU41248.1 p10 [Sucra jujuba nucleopolyhedrovirus]
MASQNILLVIREDVKELDTKVTALQTQLTELQSNVPDITNIEEKLDAQTTILTTLQSTIDAIQDILSPVIPDLPNIRQTKTTIVKK